MNQTPNYQLSQWEASDRVQRTDFNADNAKIDAAIKAVEGAIPQIAVGTYTGDGAAERFLDLGFTPKAVYICDNCGNTSANGNDPYILGGLIVLDGPVHLLGEVYGQIVEGGVKLIHRRYSNVIITTNRENTEYHYFAIG